MKTNKYLTEYYKDKDKIIELTVQTCANNNTKLFEYTPMFDINEDSLTDAAAFLGILAIKYSN